ncbi:unnamed protein product [Caenorhabditis angaria]|uniref:Uncharacterized protein n=1 Tax=Caenorhabditis angaria TaxID=860376 RepID=A0A9P1IKP2_9PELO|nr:unnamed protein product [Caenorhabditis angaria]
MVQLNVPRRDFCIKHGSRSFDLTQVGYQYPARRYRSYARIAYNHFPILTKSLENLLHPVINWNAALRNIHSTLQSLLQFFTINSNPYFSSSNI